MVIAFAIIALVIISGLSIWIYTTFIPFMQNIAEINGYNTAYYGAIAWVERALLVAKQQQYWFNGSWWRKWSTQRWPVSDHKDISMWLIAVEDNGIQREIQWTTTQIPHEGKWNIPTMLAAQDSSSFNSIKYTDKIYLPMQINNNTDPQLFYASTSSIAQPARSFVATQRRIPPYIQSQQDEITASLCDTYNEVCNNDDSDFDDDIIIAWKRKWSIDEEEFEIIPTTQIIETGSGKYIGENDMHIRESIINWYQIPTIMFWNKFNPIVGKTDGGAAESIHLTTGSWGDLVKNIVFEDIFTTPNITDLGLEYSMTQKPISKAWFIYPFLEYTIYSDLPISDTHRHIQSQSTVGNYNTHIYIRKPQNNSIEWSSFIITS